MGSIKTVVCPLLFILLTVSSARSNISEYTLPPSRFIGPTTIAAGGDGAIWLGFQGSGLVVRVTTDGSTSSFPVPVGLWQLTAGPDGNTWMIGQNTVSSITSTGLVTTFQLGAGSSPRGITAGPDGALWFTESGTDKIGRITTSGKLSEFALTAKSYPDSITSGSDGALWFTECDSNKIGRITVQGQITEFDAGGSCPYGIISIADGTLWYATGNGGHRITVGGVLLPGYIPAANAGSTFINGPDGNLWSVIGDFRQQGVQRVTLSGVPTYFPLQLPNAVLSDVTPYAIASGPDGRVWFTAWDTKHVFALSLPTLAAALLPAYPVARQSFQMLASVGDSQAASLSNIKASFDWGDGSNSDATVQQGPNNFLLFANHSYTRDGDYVVTLKVSDNGNGLQTTTQERLPVARPQLTSLGVIDYPTAHSPIELTNGPDGAIWYTADHGSIGRITTEGVSSTVAETDPNSFPAGITVGPDRAIWFTELLASKIGRVDSSGKLSEYPLPPHSLPMGITSGPDGNLWFGEVSGAGRITPNGSSTQFPLPFGGAGITAGPDGAIWTMDFFGEAAERIMTDGSATVFATDQHPVTCGLCAQITNGPDGALWFTINPSVPDIGRVAVNGDMQIFPVDGVGAEFITAGSDGNLWFTDTSIDRISRFQPDGTITNIQLKSGAAPLGIISGPDGNIWFAEHDAIGKLILHVAIAVGARVIAFPGQQFTSTVATIQDNETIPSSSFTALIDWGDGSSSQGTVTGSSPTFVANGEHAYSHAGTYSVKVSIHEPANNYTFTTVSKAEVEDFAFDPTPDSAAGVTMQPNGTASANFILKSIAGAVTDPVSFSCSGLPAGMRCLFSPGQLVLGETSQTIKMTVSSGNSVSSDLKRQPMLWALVFPAFGVVLLGGIRRRQKAGYLPAIALLLLVLPLGCRGFIPQESQSPTSAAANPTVQAGTYTIVATATATNSSGASLQHSAKLTLSVP